MKLKISRKYGGIELNKTTSERLNIIILSMVTKQKILNDLESKVFQVDIYEKYIDNLMEINLELLNLDTYNMEEKKDQYKKLIESYVKGKIKNQNQILDKLKTK